MNKNLIKKLASLYGLKLQYFDEKDKPKNTTVQECLEFLETLDLNLESNEELEKQIKELELKNWSNFLDSVQVVKNDKYAVIKIKIPKKLVNKNINWEIQEEKGQKHQGNLIPSKLAISGYNHIKKTGVFYQFDFPLPVTLETGYHAFKIFSPENKTYSMKLIVTPNNAYIPKTLGQNKKFQGARLRLKSIKTATSNRLIDSSDLRYVIRKIDNEKTSLLSINAINQVKVKDKESYDITKPTSKLFFNTMYLNIDKVIDFVEDKTLAVKVLSAEYKKLFEIENPEEIDYQRIYTAKLEAFKLIYQSFRQTHINQNTSLAEEFYNYVNSRGEKFKKIALFRALEEYFYSEDSTITSWREWPETYLHPSSEEVDNFRNNNIELVQFYEFWQWQEDLQLEQVGKISYEQNLDVGILSDLPYDLDPDGADSWLKQELFCHKNSTFFIIPNKFKEDCYEYFIEILRTNMRHVGGIKICNLLKYSQLDLPLINNNKCKINYDIESILGILALESQRNKCLLICDKKDFEIPKLKQLTFEYNILCEDFFDFINIETEKDFKEIFVEPKNKKNIHLTQPLSTYRLQLNKDFNFKQAKELIPYLKDLGISHCYISPVLKARSESSHGYDIVSHKEFHPSIGSREDFNAFSDCIHENGMGLICDIVPNHMGINHENAWWYDLLENGQSSEFSEYFDIDWNPINKNLKNKVLMPVLGEHYGDILNKNLLKLSLDSGKIILNYYDHKFPINPSSYPLILSHRLEVLEARLGYNSEDYLEYLSIITSFNNLPEHTETDQQKKFERKREKNIAIKRLGILIKKNNILEEFVKENLLDFESKNNDPISCNRLNLLLEEQAYHLAYWRVSVDEINYRRFFDVNDLAAICVENPTVFHNTHDFILDLIEEGRIDGLRIDHPDGLSDPSAYFQKLQLEVSKKIGLDFFPEEDSQISNYKLPIYIWAEKILANFEKTPQNWAIHGTVGYDFLNSLNGIFVKNNNEEKFTRIYRRFIGKQIDYNELTVNCKKLIMQNSLAGELSVLANRLTSIAQNDYNTRDFTYNNIRSALTEVIAYFPVYRTYIFNENFYHKNADYIKWAVNLAKKNSSSTELSIYDFIEKNLLMEFNKNESFDNDVVNFAKKFQQYTSPLMAKGLEDTAFYRFNRLVSLNEVGAEPNEFGTTLNEFHNSNINRLNETPLNMLSSSTHDTKRSEDVRARINVISEIPEKWQKICNSFAKLNSSRKIITEDATIPSRNDEYLFYQTMLGIWPKNKISEKDLENLYERLSEYMLKAMREAKLHTSWININSDYEEGVINFINKVIFSYNKHPFWKEFNEFNKLISDYGEINSLAQTVLKLTSPGVCDIYQGMEELQLQLVDPDNRRPVNFEKIKEDFYSLKHYVHPDSNNPPDYNEIKRFNIDQKKLYLTALGLKLRKNKPNLIIKGEYIPLETSGENYDKIVAFARLFENQACITIAPRLAFDKLDNKHLDIKDTYINIPDELQNIQWKNIIDNKNIEKHGDKIKIDFETMSIMLLENINQ